MNITKKSHTHRRRGQMSRYQRVGGGARQRWGGTAQMAEYKAQGYIVPHGGYCQYITTTANIKNLKVV